MTRRRSSAFCRIPNLFVPSLLYSGPTELNLNLMSDSELSVGSALTRCDYIPTDPVISLQLMLPHLNEVRNEWFMIGIALGVPFTKLREIEATYTKEGMTRCVLEMVQYWLDTTPAACWEQVARALEQVNQLRLATTIKQKYLWDQPPG